MDTIDAAQTTEEHARLAALSVALAPPAGYGDGPEWIDGKPLCRDCGEEIPAARLRILPKTGLCVSCAEAAQA